MLYRTDFSGRSSCNEKIPPGAVTCTAPGPNLTAGRQTVVSQLAISVTVAADAVGTATQALVSVTAQVVNRGLLSYASGQVIAIAAASAADGDLAYALTSIDLGLSSGTLLSISDASYGIVAGVGASVTFLAIDLAFPNLPGENVTEHAMAPLDPASQSGNVASFTANLTATGENGSVDLSADVFASEGLMSSVTLSGQAGVYQVTDFATLTGSRYAESITTKDESTIVRAGAGKDVIHAGSGDDWLFGEDGKDDIFAGAGGDAIFGGVGDDLGYGQDGSDWLFGGRGADQLYGGAGDDLLLGGVADDTLDGSDGNDLLDGGLGDDVLFGGSGADIFRLGADSSEDVYRGGSGADLWWITGDSDDDVILDFRVAEGDRILRTDGDWNSAAALAQRNGAELFLGRSSRDSDDLEITFRFGNHTTTLTLDEFFALNPTYSSAMPRRGFASDLQAAEILRDVFGDDAAVFSHADLSVFKVGDYIGDMG